MIVEKGMVHSLKEIGEKFLEFVKKSDATVQAWEVVDTRLSSFYGATIKVPMPDKTRTDYNAVNNVSTDITPYFYISLQHSQITKTSYKEFLNEEDEYLSELFNRAANFGEAGKYGLNPFKNTGEFIAVGLHTKYDKDLWMCEQGHITCDEEAREQLNKQALMPCLGMAMGASRPGTSTYVAYPGSGCPWFTFSDKNKKDYITELHGIDYWFTKNNYNATITLRVKGMGDKPILWQNMCFGRMASISDDSYMFPLYVAGGSQGISNDIYVFNMGGSSNTYIAGNSYDLNMDNIALANSYLLYPVKYNGSDVSNFKILAPDGVWKNIFGYRQETEVRAVPSCGVTTDYGAYMLAPEVIEDVHKAIPFLNEYTYMNDTRAVIDGLDRDSASGIIGKISVTLNKNLPYNTTGLQGTLPLSYYTWSRTLGAGEVVLKGKKYLSVPNGWDTRLKNYFAFVGIAKLDDQMATRNTQEEYMSLFYNHRFVHNLLIPLEDVEKDFEF